ncbi:hypothetical protein SARC_05515 [Sphaeroforma arctica JP610]|uniref:Uncharacterized protein n=1 Tax=Sphaeroforma arctica JP610 TaxID=667725 RepID=A0A0L0FZF0_9EUKA|nr:hypothetical protein SARC_05515 [Sphaeroforma arctica JP610]KNC82195.1 hypothetical protein SARC_05515 [Sphaeroforma arctica JP610]|eukprot:XP_014156097.1 hypothetical protein SARC_05515 [Sphaeroforma arctica JP610]
MEVSNETPHRSKRNAISHNMGHTPKHLTPKPHPSAALSMDLSSIQQVLTEIQNKPTRVPIELEQVNAASANIQNNLDSETEHFGKLKLILIELETKNCFLEHLNDLNGNFDDKELEESLVEEKAKVRHLKQANEVQYKQVQAMVESLGEHYEPCRQELALAQELLGTTTALRDEVRQLKRQTREPLYINDEQMTKDNAQDILDAQKQRIVELLDSEQTVKSEIADLQWQITQADEAKENLRQQANELNTQLMSIEVQETDGVSVKTLSERKQWHDDLLGVMRKMSHTRARLEDCTLHVDITNINPVTNEISLFTLTVVFGDDLDWLVSATLTPAEQVNINPIVREAIATNDVVFLIQEVKHHIQFITAINTEVQRLAEIFPVEWSPQSQRASVTVKDGRVVTMFIQDAVIRRGYTVQVCSIRPGVGGDVSKIVAGMQQQLVSAGATDDLGACVRLLYK